MIEKIDIGNLEVFHNTSLSSSRSKSTPPLHTNNSIRAKVKSKGSNFHTLGGSMSITVKKLHSSESSNQRIN